MSHTKEPWFLDGDERHPDGGAFLSAYFCHVDGGRIGKTFFNCGADEDTCRANARRIVACVNACAGLPDDAFDGGWTAAGLSAYAKTLEARSDELLKALKLCHAQLNILAPDLGRVHDEKAALDAGAISINKAEQSL